MSTGPSLLRSPASQQPRRLRTGTLEAQYPLVTSTLSLPGRNQTYGRVCGAPTTRDNHQPRKVSVEEGSMRHAVPRRSSTIATTAVRFRMDRAPSQVPKDAGCKPAWVGARQIPQSCFGGCHGLKQLVHECTTKRHWPHPLFP